MPRKKAFASSIKRSELLTSNLASLSSSERSISARLRAAELVRQGKNIIQRVLSCPPVSGPLAPAHASGCTAAFDLLNAAAPLKETARRISRVTAPPPGGSRRTRRGASGPPPPQRGRTWRRCPYWESGWRRKSGSRCWPSGPPAQPPYRQKSACRSWW